LKVIVAIFFVHLDESRNFTTMSLATMLSETPEIPSRYGARASIPLAADAILGNAGAIISFRLGVMDAEILSREFYPKVALKDLIGLPNYNIHLKQTIDGAVSKSFSALTVPVT
jgi:hypothetical protein